jgi:hypothetical protein
VHSTERICTNLSTGARTGKPSGTSHNRCTSPCRAESVPDSATKSGRARLRTDRESDTRSSGQKRTRAQARRARLFPFPQCGGRNSASSRLQSGHTDFAGNRGYPPQTWWRSPKQKRPGGNALGHGVVGPTAAADKNCAENFPAGSP